MRIVRIPRSRSNSIDVELEHANMVIDPRYIDMFGWGRKFRCSVNGRILTIARIDDDTGWDRVVYLHAYLPTETIPDFTSTVYTYWGLEDEFVPQDATKVIFHPSVTTIRGSAFDRCRSLVRVTIPDTVTSIEGYAFAKCFSLRFIRLSTNLEFIGEAAFKLCTSLEAVFLPPTITSIGDYVFQECTSLRFCILPVPIDHVGFDVFDYCDRLSRTVRNYLSRVCYSTSITSQVIQECIHTHGIERATEVNDEQMTALHILCSNPHVTADCIRTYLQLAPEAAEQEDSDGMTPFQYLCRNDVTVLDDRTFSSVMAFWYGCMPPLIETGTKRKRE